MNVHTKINQRMSLLVYAYNTGLYHVSDTPKQDYLTLIKHVPKYLRYGGQRNTCYDMGYWHSSLIRVNYY